MCYRFSRKWPHTQAIGVMEGFPEYLLELRSRYVGLNQAKGWGLRGVK